MKILSQNGWITYARFRGNVCEAWAYGDPADFPVDRAHVIIRALRRNHIRVVSPKQNAL